MPNKSLFYETDFHFVVVDPKSLDCWILYLNQSGKWMMMPGYLSVSLEEGADWVEAASGSLY